MRGLVLALVLVAGVARSAAGLPDWAQPIAGAAPALPEGVSKFERRVLLEELRVAVEPDGRLRVRRRVAEQYLRVPTRPFAEQGIGIDDESRVIAARGWHLPASGRSERSRGEAVEISSGAQFLTDARARVVPLVGVGKGSLVFFELEVLDRSWGLDYECTFGSEASLIDLARFEVATPPGWTVRHAWLVGPGAAPKVEGNVSRWELTGVVPFDPPEELTESAIDRYPSIVVSFAPPPASRVETPFFDGWADLGRWYESLSRGRDAATPSVVAALGAATVGAGDGRFEKILAASRFVRDGVRYVAKEVGIGAFQPRPAEQVLTARHGDCKDKATLLQSLLAAGGIRAFPILVHASREHTVADDVASVSAFNHVVLGVALDGEVDVPEWSRQSIVDAGDIGRLLVVDTTEEATAPGWLPAYLCGKRALVVAGDRSRLVRLPGDVPEAHRIERRIEGSVEDGGRLRISHVTEHRGWPASRSRTAYRRSNADWRVAAERDIRQRWSEAEIESYEVVAETSDGAFVETARILAPLPPGDPPLLAAFPDATDRLDRVSLGRREAAVVYPHAVELRVNSRWTGPFARPLPEATAVSGDGWSVASRLDADGEAVSGTWTLSLGRRRFEAAEFTELKRLWAAAERASRATLVLSR